MNTYTFKFSRADANVLRSLATRALQQARGNLARWESLPKNARGRKEAIARINEGIAQWQRISDSLSNPLEFERPGDSEDR
jgi:hypothetical protein